MEIYKYFNNTKEWNNFVNSKLSGKERNIAFDNYVKKHGTKVNIKEYFNDYDRNNRWKDLGYSYKCIGDADNCIERLVKGEIDYDDDLMYCSVVNKFPEDLCESRTDWDEMCAYADGLNNFINQLKSEIANGKLTNALQDALEAERG